MAEIGLKAFEAALKADEELRDRYEDALKSVGKASSDGEAMVKAAAELGFDISLEELEQAWAAAQELDDDELENVAGGALDNGQAPTGGIGEDEYGHNNWCLTAWHCATVTMHTSTESEHVFCWDSYQCWIWDE